MNRSKNGVLILRSSTCRRAAPRPASLVFLGGPPHRPEDDVSNTGGFRLFRRWKRALRCGILTAALALNTPPTNHDAQRGENPGAKTGEHTLVRRGETRRVLIGALLGRALASAALRRRLSCWIRIAVSAERSLVRLGEGPLRRAGPPLGRASPRRRRTFPAQAPFAGGMLALRMTDAPRFPAIAAGSRPSVAPLFNLRWSGGGGRPRGRPSGADGRPVRRSGGDPAPSARPERAFSKQFGDGGQSAEPSPDAPRAAVYEGRMGSKHRQAARMQSRAEGGRFSMPSSRFSVKASPKLITAAAVAACLVLSCLFPVSGGAAVLPSASRERPPGGRVRGA